MKKLLLGLLAAAVAYLALWPVPIDPVAWNPPAFPDGYAYNEKLKGIERLVEGVGEGPEAVAVDASGAVYSGWIDGRVFKVDTAGTLTQIANTGGRPLGVALDEEGTLWVADAKLGLLKIENGAVKVMSTEAEGVKFGFVDDLDIGPDGAVYFSDASSKFGYGQHMEEAFEHGANGRVLKFDPATGKTTVVARDLVFPNGVAVGYRGQFLLVNETLKYRVLKIWLTGDKAGTVEPFIDNLPGFPDNVTYNGLDTVWVALYSPRTADLDALLPIPWLRKIIYRLPTFLHPTPAKHAFALGVGLDGKVKHNLQYKGEGGCSAATGREPPERRAKDGAAGVPESHPSNARDGGAEACPETYAPITSVRQYGDTLYFGSLSYPALGKIKLSAALSAQ